MKMKRIILLITLSVLISFSSFGQAQGSREYQQKAEAADQYKVKREETSNDGDLGLNVAGVILGAAILTAIFQDSNSQSSGGNYAQKNTYSTKIERQFQNSTLVSFNFSNDGYVNNKKYGFINSNRKLISSLYDDYKEILKGSTQVESSIKVKSKNKYAIVDKKGKLLSPWYDAIDGCSHISGFCQIKLNNKYGVINGEGRIIVPAKYDDVYFSQTRTYIETEIIEVKLNYKEGVIDGKGKIIVPVKYDEIYTSGIKTNHFRGGGFTEVWLNDKGGIIDHNGKEIVPIKYDFIDTKYSGYGLLEVGFKDKYGLINSDGKVIIPIKYDFINYDSIDDGLIKVELDNKNINYTIDKKRYRLLD